MLKASPAIDASAPGAEALESSPLPARLLDGEDRFYGEYPWCLNAFPTLGEIVGHLGHDIERLDRLDEDWQRLEVMTNVFLLSCAVADTVDDYLHGDGYDFSKLTSAVPGPMEDNNDWGSVRVEGQEDLHVSASDIRASAEYFDSVGTRVLMGRGIGVRDTPASATVAVVNESFVKKFFKPGENPVGLPNAGPDPLRRPRARSHPGGGAPRPPAPDPRRGTADGRLILRALARGLSSGRGL